MRFLSFTLSVALGVAVVGEGRAAGQTIAAEETALEGSANPSEGEPGQTYLRITGPNADHWAAALAHGLPETHRAAVTPDDLTALLRIEGALAEAWRHMERLQPAAALAVLAHERAAAMDAAHVPHMAKWLAEVEAMTAIVSAQLSGAMWQALVDQSLRRMASLDPTRVLQPAEAPPALVARAMAALQQVRAAQRTEFRLAASAPGAVAYLDGQRLGSLPLRVETRAGRHQLRVEAPGHRPFGRILDLEGGRGLPMFVRLNPTVEATTRRRVSNAEHAPAAMAILEPNDRLVWIETGVQARAVVRVCDVDHCWHDRQTDPQMPTVATVVPHTDPGLSAADRRWLDEAPLAAVPPEPTRRWYQRWGVWVGIGTAVIVGAAAIYRATERAPRTTFQTRIDFEPIQP